MIPKEAEENYSEYAKKYDEAWSFIVGRYQKGLKWRQMLSAGVGWIPIVKNLISELDRIWEGFKGAAGKDCWNIIQCKEKFGALRFYVEMIIHEGEDQPADHEERYRRHLKAISDAEEKSMSTCEQCGLPGETREVGGWLSTCCPTDYEDFIARRVKRGDKRDDLIDDVQKMIDKQKESNS